MQVFVRKVSRTRPEQGPVSSVFVERDAPVGQLLRGCEASARVGGIMGAWWHVDHLACYDEERRSAHCVDHLAYSYPVCFPSDAVHVMLVAVVSLCCRACIGWRDYGAAARGPKELLNVKAAAQRVGSSNRNCGRGATHSEVVQGAQLVLGRDTVSCIADWRVRIGALNGRFAVAFPTENVWWHLTQGVRTALGMPCWLP